MKNKKIFMYIGIIILILIVLGLGYLIFININFNKDNNTIDEYIPEPEITDEQLRETIVTLYFMNVETAQIEPEARKIDAKELLENPYKKIIQLLIEGPKNEKLTKLIPDNTLINSVYEKSGIVTIDFSEAFINEQRLGKEQEEMIINSIVKSLTELTEVTKIRILINGEENKSFPDEGVIFNRDFSIN